MIKKYYNKIFNSNLLFVNGFMLAFVRVVTMLVSVINTMILSRLLSLTEYGTYSELLIIVSIFTIVTNMGMENAVNFFYNKFPEEKSKYIGNIFLIVIFSGISAAIIIFCLKNAFVNFYNNNAIGPLIIYICLKPLLDNIASIFQPLYISLNRSKVIAIRNLIFSIAKVILIPLSFYLTKDIRYIFIVQLIIDVIQIIYLYLLLDSETKHILLSKLNLNVMKEVLKYAIPLFLALMAGTLFKESDKIIISKLASIEDLAIYANMAKQLPFEFVVTSFTAVVTPLMVKLLDRNKEKAVYVWKNYLKFGYFITWILCVGAIVCSKELLLFLYSEKYISGLNIFIVYLLAEMFRYTYFGLILTSYGKTKLILLSSFSALILNIILNIILYKIIGFAGPAVASLFCTIFMGFVQLLASCKLLKIRFFDVVELKEMILLLLKLIIYGIIIYTIKNYTYGFLSSNTLILIIYYGLFVFGGLLINKNRIIHALINMKGDENEIV